MHPFCLGQEYLRSALLDFVGSRQAQPGVIWGDKEPGCVICTSGGRHGKKAGYADGEQPDGSWFYVGQGTSGDQRLDNAANAKLASRQRSVLLFTTREPTAKEVAAQGYGKLYVFRGAFNVSGHEFFSPQSGPRQGCKLIRFVLVPAHDSFADTAAPESADVEGSSEALRAMQAALGANSISVPTRTTGMEYRLRSAAVHRYALLRARGVCECCDCAAPFATGKGVPYLEVHHLLRLADDGPDAPENVAAVCPNCHRALHLSAQRTDLAALLKGRVAQLEDAIRRGVEVIEQGSIVCQR